MENSPEVTASNGPAESPSRFSAIIEDGVLAGITGALVVAVWFLIIDTARGQVFFTPSLLGNVLFLTQSVDDATSVNAMVVFAYTGLHGVMFLMAGVAIAAMFHQFEANPQLGLVLLLLFVLFEAVVFGFEVAIVPSLVGAIGALAVAIANLFAAAAMFLFLLRRHPTAMARLRGALSE